MTWEKRIKTRFYRLAAFCLLAIAAFPAPAQSLRERVHAALEQRGLGDDGLRIIANVLEHEGSPPPRTPALVARILADPLAATDAAAVFAASIPQDAIAFATMDIAQANGATFDQLLERYLSQLQQARAALAAAVAPFDDATLLAGLQEGIPLPRLVELHRAVDATQLDRARGLFLDATREFIEAIRSTNVVFPAPRRFLSSIGTVVIGSPGNDRHAADAALIIDPGGDDVYERKPASGGAVSVIIDLGGNDRYSGTDVAVRSLSAIVDLGGNDVYKMDGAGIGAAIAGVSVVLDLDGDDEYDAAIFGQGAALFGFGALIDRRGNDRYRIKAFGQGYGATAGVGLLWDGDGNDRYSAEGLPDAYDRGGGISFTQGAAAGARGALAGGVGILRDDAGDDRYESQMFAQGSGYYYALGMLWDQLGNDSYSAVRYAQGNGTHQAVGILRDDDGSDGYALSVGVGQGMGLDLAVGVLLDAAGDDRYRADVVSQGSATANGFGLLADEAGASEFQMGPDPRSWGHTQWLRGLPTVGVLLYDPSRARFTRSGKPDAPAAPRIEPEPPEPSMNCAALNAEQQTAMRRMLDDPGAELDDDLLGCAFSIGNEEETARLWMAIDALLVTPGTPYLRPIAFVSREHRPPAPVIEHLGAALRLQQACEPHALWVANWASAQEAREALGSPCWRLQAAALERLKALGVPTPSLPSTPQFLRPE